MTATTTPLSTTVTAENHNGRLVLHRDNDTGYARISLSSQAEAALLKLLLERQSQGE